MAGVNGKPHREQGSSADRSASPSAQAAGEADGSVSPSAQAAAADGKPSLIHPIRRFRAFMRSCSLKTAFVVYAIAATAIAFVVSMVAAGLMADVSMELRSEASERSGLYIYVEDADALVPAESLSWYEDDGGPLYVEVASQGAPDAIPVGDASADSGAINMRIYDGRVLDDADLAEGATNDTIPLAAVPAYDAAQKSRILADSEEGTLLPSDERGNVPASSPLVYYVIFDPENGLYDVMQLLTFLMFPLVFAVVFIIAARLFYRNHMKRPIAGMEEAASRIAENDLDFELTPDSGNELGRLTESFETMRASLLTSNREMWRMVEARKEANAAFAHDLRTPLTVLRGQIEMLAAYTAKGSLSADQIEEMARSSQRQVERIERYVEDMRDLAKLDDCEVVPADLDASGLVERLDEAARALAADCGKRSETIASGLPETVCVDAPVVERVVGNLLANAARYAAGSIVLTCCVDENDLVVTVEDDGPGYSGEALKRGLEPYFRDTSRDDSSEHFGLGLGICSVLVAKCGGSIALANRDSGGACATVRFPCVSKR